MICISERESRKRTYREQLLDDLLKKPFDLNGFKTFAALFSCDAGFSTSKDHIDAICRSYADCIDSCMVIAGFTGIDGARVALISVKLKTARYAGHSGTLQRCFMSRFLAETRSDAAVAAFHCDGERSWRLSFVRPVEGFDAKGVKLEITPVKRFSFIAGEELPHDPVQKQLHKIFLYSSLTPSLHEIEQVFSQSKIAGRFIKECCNILSDGFPGEVTDKTPNERYGRLLYELPGKLRGKLPDKLPDECGIEKILQNYGFSFGESELNDEIAAIDGNMIGRLFESLLNGKARKRSGTFYTSPEIVRYMCIEAISNYLANKTGIPYEELRIFLQYGEWLADEDCCIAGGIATDITADIPAGMQTGAPVKLSAAVTAEAPEKKTAGESAACSEVNSKLPAGVLHRLNEIDHALAGMKVLDPATGSGAFPLCMLNEIVKARMNITEYLLRAIPAGNTQERMNLRENRNPYALKYNAIKNCIYAADIEDTACDLTKLRLWLSLVAANENAGAFVNTGGHENAPCSENADGTPGLPSFSELVCNVVCADSLLDEIEWTNWKRKERKHFDIVIGNPPYISAVEGSRNDSGMREALRSKYPLLKGAFDIYTAFLLEGIEKTTADGAYCWIIPNKLLVSGYAKPVLTFMKQNGMRRTISVSDIGAFSGTGIYPVIVSGNRRSNVHEEYTADSLHALVYDDIKPKIKPRSYKTFADFGIRFASGAAGFQAKLLSGCITEHAANGAIPFIVSGSADKFHVNYNNVRYMGRTYSKAYISKGKGISENKWNLWCSEKIVIAGLTREIEAVYCTGPLALGVGVYAICGFAGFDPLFLLGLLNSKFMSWYLNVSFNEKHLAGGYLAINKSTLEQLPLVYADENTRCGIAEIAYRIQETTAIGEIGAETVNTGAVNMYMAQLDEMVYGLYGLDASEIKVVEDFFKFRKR